MNYTDPDLQNQTIDLTNCDREPIHIPGRIQSFGALLGFTSDLIVTHASQNVEAGGRSSLDLIGEPLPDMLDPAALNLVRNRLQGLQGRDAVDPARFPALIAAADATFMAFHSAVTAVRVEEAA